MKEDKSELRYEEIWNKTLKKNEKIEYEFTIALIIVCLGSALGACFLFFEIYIAAPLLFYYGFYLRAANAYAFTNARVLVQKGWLSTNMISVDYSKITDVRIKESIIEKLFLGTGTIIINTAGSSASEIIMKSIKSPYELRKKLDSLMD
jgi:uncharacterized membrane protein YdbT with pleckstrin-like domain